MKTSTKVLLGVFVLGICAIVAAKLFEKGGAGEIVVFAPVDQTARVRIDGGQPVDIDPGGYLRIEAEHGEHTVTVEAPTPLDRVVVVGSGLNTVAVPTLAEQCFAELDVTLSHYGESDPSPRPNVSQTERHAESWQLGDTHYLAESELPSEAMQRVSRGEIVDVELIHLYRTVPCGAIEAGDEAVLVSLGY